MPAFFTLGRILFALLFVAAGVSKLMDLSATAQMTEKIVLPAMLAPYTAQLETLAGMPLPKILAITAAALELVCGIMIALNFVARFFAFLLILFVAAATFYFHDFWNQASGPEATNNIMHALKNLAIIGALFMIIGANSSVRLREPGYDV